VSLDSLPCFARAFVWQFIKRPNTYAYSTHVSIIKTHKETNIIIWWRLLQKRVVCTNFNMIYPRYYCVWLESLQFIEGLLKKNEKKLARTFNFTFRYIVDVHSLKNSRFGDFVDRIYPIELEIKDTTDTDRSAPYLEIDREGRLRTQ